MSTCLACGQPIPAGAIGVCGRCRSGGRGIPRIGRPPTPAEAELRAALEDPMVLTARALECYARQCGLAGDRLANAWATLSPQAQAEYRRRALVELRVQAAMDG